MFSFVETKPKRRPDRGPEDFSTWGLIVAGVFLISGSAFVFLPFGYYSTAKAGIIALIVLFLPMFFFALYLTAKLGYGILIAVFLALPSAGIGFLVLGDFLGVVTEKTIVENIRPSESVLYPHKKLYTFRDYQIWEPALFSREEVLATNLKLLGNSYKGILRTWMVPLVDHEFSPTKDPITVWLVCTELVDNPCSFPPEVSSGVVYPLWEDADIESFSLKKAKEKNLKQHTQIQYLRWVPQAKERVLQTGIYGLGILFLLNVFWCVAVILVKKI